MRRWYAERPLWQQYCGLANEGTTCYLNSLLQALFMIKEVRQAVFAFEYAGAALHGEAADCVPLQLAHLFARLQLSSRQAVSTRALTSSFGWSRAEQYQQHDVQELCRVLFEALSKFGLQCETELFGGQIEDVLRCRECGFESKRSEAFSVVKQPSFWVFTSCTTSGFIPSFVTYTVAVRHTVISLRPPSQ